MGGEKLIWHQLAHNQLISLQGPHFSPHSTAKTNDKSTNLRKNGIYLYKFCCARLMKLMKMIIIMNKSQETTVSHGQQKLTSAMKLRAEK